MTEAAEALITTIIPTYRRPDLLRRAIRSVLDQTYPHFQVCVYDNNSGDQTAAVVAEFLAKDSRVSYHCHSENIGALNNFAYGLAAVKTPFFSFLSDDDLLLPDFFQAAVAELRRFPNAAFFAGGTIIMTEDGKVQRFSSEWPSEGYQEPPGGMFTMLNNRLTWTSILFRTNVLDDVGDLDPKTGAASDLDFLLRIAARFPFVVSSRPAAIYLDHSGSHSAVVDLEYTWPALLHMIRNLTDDTRIPIETCERVERVLTEDLIQRLFFVGGNSIRLKNFADAYEIADILRTRYHRSGFAAIISISAWCCKHIRIVHAVFLSINRLRKIFRYRKVKSLQKRFGQYSQYLRHN